MSNFIGNSIVLSMAGKAKDETGLPVNIYIDDGGTYLAGGHGKRLKFQMNHGDRAKGQPFASMSLSVNKYQDDQAFIKTYVLSREKGELSGSDLKAIANFIQNNRYALDKVADQEIFIRDFDKVMIKGGDIATEDEIAAQRLAVDKIIENLE